MRHTQRSAVTAGARDTPRSPCARPAVLAGSATLPLPVQPGSPSEPPHGRLAAVQQVAGHCCFRRDRVVRLALAIAWQERPHRELPDECLATKGGVAG